MSVWFQSPFLSYSTTPNLGCLLTAILDLIIQCSVTCHMAGLILHMWSPKALVLGDLYWGQCQRREVFFHHWLADLGLCWCGQSLYPPCPGFPGSRHYPSCSSLHGPCIGVGTDWTSSRSTYGSLPYSGPAVAWFLGFFQRWAMETAMNYYSQPGLPQIWNVQLNCLSQLDISVWCRCQEWEDKWSVRRRDERVACFQTT